MFTTLFDEVSERGFRESPPGMAHWAGTGPLGRKCRHCAFFSGKAGKKGACGKFTQIMHKKGPKFAGYIASCKYFAVR